MASFKDRIGWKRPGIAKNDRFVPFLPDAEQKMQKKKQKN